jgi:hypothetical protein
MSKTKPKLSWDDIKKDPERLKYFKFNWAKNAIRRASYRWPGRYNAKKRNYITVEYELKNGEIRLKEQCFCDLCGIISSKNFFQLDHKETCVPLTGWISFDNFIDRMMCLEEEFQIICKPCHKDITNNQLKTRVINRKNKKVDK